MNLWKYDYINGKKTDELCKMWKILRDAYYTVTHASGGYHRHCNMYINLFISKFEKNK